MGSRDSVIVHKKTSSREIQVLLTLYDGERSFGMSLAQKTPTFGLKYTVVSSVFAKSPADRAGYIVRYINDKPMGGLTVAEVANHFRNVVQARITLEIVENQVPSKTLATKFGGAVTVSVSHGQRVKESVTGVAVVSSGTVIAAPGSALAGVTVTAPKQRIPSTAFRCGNASTASANGKKIASVSDSRLKSITPVRRLTTAQKGTVVTTTPTLDSMAKSVLGKPSNASETKQHATSSRIPQSPVKVIEAPRIVASVQVRKENEKLVTATQLEDLLASPVSAALPSVPELTAAKATAPVSVSSHSKTATQPVPASDPFSIKATRAVVKLPVGNVLPYPVSLPLSAKKSSSTVLYSSSAYRVKTTDARLQVSTASVIDPPESSTQVREVVSAMPSTKVVPKSKAGLGRSTTSTPLQSTTQTSPVVPSPVPVSPVAVSASPTTMKTDKKRPRQQTTKVTNGTNGMNETNGTTGSNGSTSNKGKGKTKKKQQQERDVVDNDVFDSCAFTSDSDSEEPPSKKATWRKPKARRRGVKDRTRQSLTIVRLVNMGFKKEDAEASVKEIGDDPDACMVWIISKIEERQFNEDLNRASIQSERSKHDEEKRVKKLEREKLAGAEKFMVVFPTSYIVCTESTAPRMKKLLQSTIDQVDGKSYLRKVLSELMRLEGKSIRWYKEASRSYMLKLAECLDAALETHDVMTCCARTSAKDISSPNGCKFVQKVFEEVKALKTALFEMPTNQGGRASSIPSM
ncbi:unnamed protein product [Peronospora belbahrii]|uniref:UBA domain-containing protein n=1 Tax=Peronospora belbahrii TaxID=622444 RepID=A0AAU9L828_9STRA|nr:unnamed protein product [Peronospora belbahrii]